MPCKTELHTLYFDLSNFSNDREFTLLSTGGKKVALQRYCDHPNKLDEHGAKHPILSQVAETHLQKLTHFVEDTHLTAEKSSIRRIEFPSLDDHPLPEIAMCFLHTPRRQVEIAHARLAKLGRRMPMPYTAAHFGLVQEHYISLLQSASAQQLLDLHLAANQLNTAPGATAQAIALHHPELGSIQPGVMEILKQTYLNPLQNQNMQDFVQYLTRTAPGEGSYAWYNKSWAQWAQNDDGTGPMVAAEVNTGLKFSDGKKTDWPQAHGQSYQGLPTYDLTDEFDPPQGNPQNEGVIEASTATVQAALLGSKNDVALAGLLWNKQDGITDTTPAKAKVVNSASPSPAPAASPQAAAAKAERKASVAAPAAVPAAQLQGSDAKGFSVKNKTSSFGLYLYDLSFDTATQTVTLPVKNWPSRYLGAYVEFQKEDGTPIKQEDISADVSGDKTVKWVDKIPSLLKPLVEPSNTKNYLTWLSSGAAVFGAPVPPLTSKTELEFLWPDQASKAQVLIGGLGVANGFSDWDTDVDLVGVLGTGILNYGVGSVMLVANVYIVNPFIALLQKEWEFGFYAVAGCIGAPFLVTGIAEHDTKGGKMILSKLASIAASAIFGAVVKRAIKFVDKEILKKFTEATTAAVAEMTVEEAAELEPTTGWVLRVASVAADIAGLTATTIECLASPATYNLEVLRTMDLTVTVKPDPSHGKSGSNPIWPAVSDHYVIQVKYPAANGSEGGTTYTKAGPMPGQHDDPIVVTFAGIPAGGKIDIVASIYSNTNWLAGKWNSGWRDAVPSPNDTLTAEGAIVEFLVPLSADTSYSQKQAIGYSDAKKHFWAVSAFTVSATLVPDFDKGGTPDAAIVQAFDANGDELGNNASITVDTPMQRWTITDSGARFYVATKLIYSGQVFQMDAATYPLQLDQGGPTPSGVSSQFDQNQYTLPVDTQVTVVTAGSQWTIGLAGQPSLFDLTLADGKIDVDQTSYELTVQNSAQPAPPLPKTYPLSSAPTGNQLGGLQNIIHNNHEFALGYAYLASGQNIPFAGSQQPSQSPMYAMQSISTLGQPQDQIYQPTQGYTQPAFLAYDQFGLTPLFTLSDIDASQLKTGLVPADLGKEFAAFGHELPTGAEITVIAAGKDWSIGRSGETPLYELRVTQTQQDAKTIDQLGIYTYPVPGIDNFFLEPQPKQQGHAQEFHLKGVKLDQRPGEYGFDYAATEIWGVFANGGATVNETPFQEVAVHPSGYVIALDNTNAKLFVLKLPGSATTPDKAPMAMPLSGMGSRPGLMDGPSAMTVTEDGRILVLETGTTYIKQERIQAFDVKGNPVPSFSVGQPNFDIDNARDFIGEFDAMDVSQALLNLFQENFTPDLAPKMMVANASDAATIAADLDQGKVDQTLIDDLVNHGLTKKDETGADFTVSVTRAGKLWFVTDNKTRAVYDVRVTADEWGNKTLDVYTAFALSITLVSQGNEWKISDTANAMTFSATKAAKSDQVTIQRLTSWMPLREQQVTGSLSYLDIAAETKGYIYVLGVIDNNYSSSHDPEDLTFQLDIYSPDGSVLLTEPQTGLNAGKITVDQYRSLYSLNFNTIIGPNNRTEPGVSEWIPSTPKAATPDSGR